ncbi:MAG: DUF2855 family protein [Pseudomonadota bacterium]
MSEFQVQRKALTAHRIVDGAGADTPLDPDEVLLKVDLFAFTANNVTYGVAGDQIGYWRFFPPAGGDETWGVLPVWGFAEVIAGDALPMGERLYGYLPPAEYLKIKAGKISDSRVTDTSEHRADLPPVYNTLTRVAADPQYNPKNDDLRCLLWPLFITSFCLWDSAKDNDWYGAEQVLVMSASSKTSLGLAYALAGDGDAPKSIGVTSPGNAASVRALKLYDEVMTYDEAPEDKPTLIIDMSGNSQVLGRLHSGLGDNMKKTLNVGITHWGVPRTRDGYILDRCEFFFAPGHIQKRYQDWGPDGFAKRSGAFMEDTAVKTASWLDVRHLDGLLGLAEVYEDVCEGRMPPETGLIVKM